MELLEESSASGCGWGEGNGSVVFVISLTHSYEGICMIAFIKYAGMYIFTIASCNSYVVFLNPKTTKSKSKLKPQDLSNYTTTRIFHITFSSFYNA